MLMTKLLTAALSFVTVSGGLCYIFLVRANITNLSLVFILYLILTPILFYAYKKIKFAKPFKIAFSVLGVVSSSFSITLAARLVTDSAVIDKDFYPLLILITGALTASIAISKDSAIKSVGIICSAASLVVFVLILVLSLLDTEFSAVSPVKYDIKPLVLLSLISVLDVVFVIVQTKGKNPLAYIAGGSAAFVIFGGFVAAALTVLSPEVYYAMDTPLLKLWQSTYITSFVNRFEVVAVSFLYLLAAYKSGVVLRPVIKITGKNYISLIMIFTFALSVGFSFL